MAMVRTRSVVRHDHVVAFYDLDPDLVIAVAGYVIEGFSRGERVVVIATAPHRGALDDALSARGTLPAEMRASGRYMTLDAEQTLEKFMVGGSPDADRFTAVIGGLVESARAGGSGVRAFGEMVALLWEANNVTGALELEAMWNDLAERESFSLLCAYPTSALAGAGLGEVDRVCLEHARVLPPSSYGASSFGGGDLGGPEQSAVFIAVPEAVAAARRFVNDVLEGWGEHEIIWEAALVVSELATNALTHSGSPFRASVRRSRDVVRIGVEDAGPGLPESRAATLDDLNGRGIAIIDEIADRWGFDPLTNGKVSWAELAVRPGGLL
jgi:anti-sigma regulatory factor (Ser/Thr protein kinase)